MCFAVCDYVSLCPCQFLFEACGGGFGRSGGVGVRGGVWIPGLWKMVAVVWVLVDEVGCVQVAHEMLLLVYAQVLVRVADPTTGQVHLRLPAEHELQPVVLPRAHFFRVSSSEQSVHRPARERERRDASVF